MGASAAAAAAAAALGGGKTTGRRAHATCTRVTMKSAAASPASAHRYQVQPRGGRGRVLNVRGGSAITVIGTPRGHPPLPVERVRTRVEQMTLVAGGNAMATHRRYTHMRPAGTGAADHKDAPSRRAYPTAAG